MKAPIISDIFLFYLSASSTDSRTLPFFCHYARIALDRTLERFTSVAFCPCCLLLQLFGHQCLRYSILPVGATSKLESAACEVTFQCWVRLKLVSLKRLALLWNLATCYSFFLIYNETGKQFRHRLDRGFVNYAAAINKAFEN